MKRSCRELLYRNVSYGGPVKRSCKELLYRDVSYGVSCEEILQRALV